MSSLKMLVVTDIHYIAKADHVCKIPKRKATLGFELLNAVLEQVSDIDGIILLGDLVDNGKASGAYDDLMEIKNRVAQLNIPIIAIRGNHDCEADEFYQIFNQQKSILNISDYQFVSFTDVYNESEGSRNIAEMKEIFAKLDADKPIIVCQHNPIYPEIEASYPYNLVNADEIIDFYAKQNVLLSLSGHAHWGIPEEQRNGVSYLTCRALCEEPHGFTIIEFKDRDFKITEKKLS